jgi:hypothetical protein
MLVRHGAPDVKRPGSYGLDLPSLTVFTLIYLDIRMGAAAFTDRLDNPGDFNLTDPGGGVGRPVGRPMGRLRRQMTTFVTMSFPTKMCAALLRLRSTRWPWIGRADYGHDARRQVTRT